MTKNIEDKKLTGMTLAKRLKLKLNKLEGHDLAGPCIACKSSDAFRLHKQKGIAHCYSCNGSWSPYQVALQTLGNKAEAKKLMNELQIPLRSTSGPEVSELLREQDPLLTIAEQKSVDPEALKSYGVEFIDSTTIDFPMYGPDGEECSSYKLFTDDSKGKFAYGKPAGLFFPHTDGVVRLPEPGETWYVVEGVKDAAAMYSLGYLACGLNTCHMAAKFARLFADVKVVLIPDRDRPSVNGADKTTAGLWGVAESISIVTLPVEFKDTKGDDVRDVLQLKDGEQLLRLAIDDAELVELPPVSSEDLPDGSSAEIEMPEGDPISLTVMPCGKQDQRLIVARRGGVSCRDQININSSVSRKRFTKELASKLDMKLESLGHLVEAQLIELADQADTQTEGTSGKARSDKESQAITIARMASSWELFETPGGEAYATVPVGDHRETWPLSSKHFKRFVTKRFYEEYDQAFGPEAFSTALNLMEAWAYSNEEKQECYIRVAKHNGKIYLDLCNSKWQVLEITETGWKTVDDPPVKFERSRGMLPLPLPERGGTVNELRDFLIVEDESFFLIVAWILGALRPSGPYPLLALAAEQGSGKSTVARMTRHLIDPNRAPLRSEHRNGRDLMIAASNSWCSAFDNLSYIDPSLSDAFCRLSTGGGFSTRKLHTDREEEIFEAQRPVLLTSIDEVVTRPDLLDRCLAVRLSAIAADQRRPEEEIWKRFEEARPRILGALLDAVSGALQRLEATQLDDPPRMLDFALWVTAAEEALGWSAGAFMRAYANNRDSANELALEASPIGLILLRFLRRKQRWSGTSTNLLEKLRQLAPEETKRLRIWPKNPKSLSDHLERIRPNLREAGWEIERVRSKNERTLILRPVTQDDSDMSDESMQIDAILDESFPDDAGDANDASHPGSQEEIEQDSEDWRYPSR